MSSFNHKQPDDTPGTLPEPNWAVIDAYLAAHGLPPWPCPVPPWPRPLPPTGGAR